MYIMLLTGEGLQHVIMPSRCCNGRGEMAFAATTRVRHTGKGGNAVRPRRRWLMSTERHQQVAYIELCGDAVVLKRLTSAATSFRHKVA